MSTISINGMTIQGNSIVVKNGKVIVNGVDVTPDSKVINISVEGDVQSVEVDSCDKVVINGNAEVVSTTSGDVEVTGDVLKSVKTVSGDVECRDITGSVSTVSGDIECRKRI